MATVTGAAVAVAAATRTAAGGVSTRTRPLTYRHARFRRRRGLATTTDRDAERRGEGAVQTLEGAGGRRGWRRRVCKGVLWSLVASSYSLVGDAVGRGKGAGGALRRTNPAWLWQRTGG